MYPIIEYAHLINKNTAEFTLSDFSKFMKWWMKQPIREDMVGKQGYEAAMQSRSPEYVEPIEEEQMGVTIGNEIVADMGLTQQDIDALSWGIGQLLNMFDFSEMPEVEDSLTKLGEELEPLVTKGE